MARMNKLHLLATAAILAATSPAFAAPGHDHSPQSLYRDLEAEKSADNIYKVHFADRATARKAAISLHANLLEADYKGGFLILELDAAELDRLRPFSRRIERAAEYIERRNRRLTQQQLLQSARVPGAAEPRAIPGFACYETVEETFAVADGFIAAKPTLASWADAGDSWLKTQSLGGYDIRVLKLTNSAVAGIDNGVVGKKPKLFINTAIHAREYATTPLVLEFARWLVNGHGTDADATWILDHHEVHLMLHTNPDGRKRAEAGLSWRKNVNNNFCANTNTRGIDLNRNFNFSWNTTAGQGSSGSACSLTFRGPSAGSEPETQAMQAYVRNLWADRRGPGANDPAPADTSGIHLDIHSFSQLVLWPWGDTNAPAPNGTALQTLGRKFAFFNGYEPTQSIGLYPTDGTTDGVSYGELGVAAYTFELGTAFFQSCDVFENAIKPGNLPALIYAAKVVRAPYQTPAGPDVTVLSVAGAASAAGVVAGIPVALNATVVEGRYNNDNGVEPSQNVAGAEAFIDIPPWLPGAVALPLAAADGSFDSAFENVLATLDTTGLTQGRHTVYVRGRDALGNAGAISAVFLNIGAEPSLVVEREENNSFTNAQAVSSLPVRVTGVMDVMRSMRSGDYDHFAVTLAPGATLNARLVPNAASNYDLGLHAANGTLLAQSTLGTGQVDTASVTNTGSAPAVFYVRVLFASGGQGPTNGTYSLLLTN
jgi:carboxypeptidase T